MHRCPSPGSRLPVLTHKRLLLATSLIWFAGGCGPGAATPMPEPPSISPTLLGSTSPDPRVPETTATNGAFDIYGGKHAAPANATVSVTNLDTAGGPTLTTADANGSFKVTLPVAYGNELRFAWSQGEKHSIPTDVLFVQNGTDFTLTPSPRFDCVTLKPGFVLDFGAAKSAALEIENTCSTDLSVGAVSLRQNLPDFILPTSTPQSYASGEAASISVAYVATGSMPVEDTLFVQLSNAGTSIRYPITLFAHP
jgi:hypothetical protein